MSADLQKRHYYSSQSTPPPPPDEGYWAALLREGEYAGAAFTHPDGETSWDGYGTASLLSDGAGPVEDSAVGDDWEIVRQTYANDQTVCLPVIGYNRGGLLVSWNRLRGFVPASQLVDAPAAEDGMVRREVLAARVNQMLKLRVIELNPAQNRLILSERAAQVGPGARHQVLTTLKAGDIRVGKITNLCDFGAFVDLGGVEGLIHISELSWGRVGHPKDLLKSGQELKVYVMDVNRGQGRVALSLKRLQPDPWETVEQRYHIGQVVKGVITNVVDFGAFACIEEGLEGLIHVSELAEGHFLHPRNVVQEGQTVHARILNIDGQARRLGLSLRRVDNGSEPSDGGYFVP